MRYLIKKWEYINAYVRTGMARALGHEDEEHSRTDEDGHLSLLSCTANSLAGSRDVLGKSNGVVEAYH